MAHFIVTANRLADGGVVYLRGDRGWTERHAEAWATEDAAEAEAWLAWATGQERLICDPYVIDVDWVDGVPAPKTARERIRAEGPLPTLERLGYLREAPRRAAVG